MIVSGFGGRGGSLSSRTDGLITTADRAGTKESVIRSIAGSDLLVWIDATRTSNTLDSDLTNDTINTNGGTVPVLGTNAPSTVFSSILNSTAYSFQTNEALKFNAGLFAYNTGEVTIITRFCLTSAPSNHILFELGNLNYFSIDGGIGLGAIAGGTPSETRFWAAWGGQSPPATDGDSFILTDQVEQNVAYSVVATYEADVNPNKLDLYKDGAITTVNADAEFDGPDTANTANKAYIGCRSGDGTPSIPLNGHISDFIVITRKLTASEASRITLSLSTNHGGSSSAGAEEGGGDSGVTYNIDEVAGQNITDAAGTLYDDGGPDGTYSQTDYTTYIVPGAGKKVVITMREFEMGSVGGGNFNEKLRFFNTTAGIINFYGSMANGDANAPTQDQVINGVDGGTVTIIFDQSGYYGENGFFVQGDDGFKLTWEIVDV
jgi:hypothetical protein